MNFTFLPRPSNQVYLYIPYNNAKKKKKTKTKPLLQTVFLLKIQFIFNFVYPDGKMLCDLGHVCIKRKRILVTAKKRLRWLTVV